MFPDNCLLYSIIESTEDTTNLQQDLNILFEWPNTWQLNFNVTKYAVIRCTRITHPTKHNYTLNSQIIEAAEQHSYLGSMLNKSLSWSSHISTISSKAISFIFYPSTQWHTATSSLPRGPYMSYVGRMVQPSTLKYKPVIAHHYFYDRGLWFTRPFELKLTDFSTWERFRSSEVNRKYDLPIHGPLNL